MHLSATDLACRRSGRLLFSGLRFSLGGGRALVVTGANGAGKSSLLAILRGRLKPAAGTVALTFADERPLPEAINFVGHREGLKAMLTAHENLAFAREMLGGGALSPEAALEKFDVAHLAQLPVAYLSAGQRRRVALARLFVASRPIWLLDEPTSALDAASSALLTRLMREHLSGGGIIVAATHQPLGLDGEDVLRIVPPVETDEDGEAW
ncbi:heme ABC exporter ATP-binding protein CcmA [Pseudochelatococcus sp. B33]